MREDRFVEDFIAKVIEGHGAFPEGVQLVFTLVTLLQQKFQQGSCGALRIRE